MVQVKVPMKAAILEAKATEVWNSHHLLFPELKVERAIMRHMKSVAAMDRITLLSLLFPKPTALKMVGSQWVVFLEVIVG